MKISQEEIIAASDAFLKNGYLSEALEAAYTVRKARKVAKHERQRKEKDKQVVDSVKPHLAPYYGDGRNAGPDFVMSPKASASKALEWDGGFDIGEYQMRNGDKAVILATRLNELIGNACGEMRSWNRHGGISLIPCQFDLIRPWPKGEQ